MESHEVYDFLNSITNGSNTFPLTNEQIKNIYNFLNEKLVGKKEYKDFLFINNPTAYRKKTKLDDDEVKNDSENRIEYNSSELGKICGYSFKPGDTVYRCCDCAFDSTCVLCSRCFHASNHQGHNIKFYITKNGGGCCDCGDEEAFIVDINCKYHNIKNEMNDTLKPLPEPLKQSLKNVISQCFTFIIDILNKAPFDISVPSDDELIRKEESEDGSDKLYDCLLWNDEYHSFDIVIKKLKEATGCTDERAEMIAKNIDSHGRGCLCITEDINKLKDMSKIINGAGLRTTIRLLSETLKEEVIAYLVVYFSKLLKVVPGIISINDEKYESVKDVIRDTINHEFFRKIEDPSKYSCPGFIKKQDLTVIDLLFFYDIKIWKSTRILIKELYINTLISDQEFKVKTATKYAIHFPHILTSYLTDIEDRYNIVDFMVQTISPTSVNYIFNETNFYFDLMTLIKTNTFCNTGHLKFDYKHFYQNFELLKSLRTEKYEFESLQIVNRDEKDMAILGKVVEGITYLLQAPKVKTNFYRENPLYLQSALDMLVYLQGFLPQKCYLDYHIVNESNDWVSGVEYTYILGKLINCISDCYKYESEQEENLKYIKKAMTNILSFLDEWCYYKSHKKSSSMDKITIIRTHGSFINNLLNVRNEIAMTRANRTVMEEINNNVTNRNNTDENASSSIRDNKHGFHYVKSLDDNNYEVPNYSIMLGEISFIYPVHWLFASFVRQLPLILKNLSEKDKIDGNLDKIWNDIFSFIPITENESDNITQENRIQRLMEYPLRCMAAFSQVKSNLWIRNGATIYHMASTYSNVKLRSVSYDTNIIFLQVASLALNSNVFLTSLLDRFEVLDWFRGKSYADKRGFSNEKVNLLVDEFLLLIIRILTFRKEINGKGFEGNLRNEIIHLLIKKPLSFSEIAGKIEKKYLESEKDITSDIEDILEEVSNFKFPYGIADRGTYELKTKYYEEVDPYFSSLSFNDRETAKQKIKEYILKTSENKANGIENIVLKPRMERIDPSSGFSKLPNLCRSQVFNSIVFYSIFNCTNEKKEEDKDGLYKPEFILDNSIYLMEIAIEEERRCIETQSNMPEGNESFIWNAAHQNFTFDSSKMDGKVKLVFDNEDESNEVEETADEMKEENTNEPEIKSEEMKENSEPMNIESSTESSDKTMTLVQWLVYLVEKSNNVITNFIPRICSILKNVNQMTEDDEIKDYIDKWFKQKILREHKQQLLKEKEEEENRLKKKRAMARKAELMAQFAQQQNNFMMNTNFDEYEFEDEDYEYNEEEYKIQHIYQFPTGSCIMCRESDECNDNLIGMLGFAQTSCHVRQVKFNNSNDVYENLQMNFSFDQEQERSNGNTVEESKAISVLPSVNPVHSQSGIYVSTCGHMMHSKCLEKYMDTISRDQESNPRRNYSVNIKHNEFLCPLCKNICNILLPVVWKDKHYTIRNFESQEGDQEISNFSKWLLEINNETLTDETKAIQNYIEKVNGEYKKSLEKQEVDQEENVHEKDKEPEQGKGFFELKSFVDSNYMKDLCESKIIKTLKYIKTELLHEKVKSIDDKTLLTDLLHETFKYTIQTVEVMMRGVKQDSSSESTIAYPFIGLIEHINPKILNLLRIMNEIILTYTAIKIQNEDIKEKHFKRAIKLGQMIFGKKLVSSTSSMELDGLNENSSSDESEYFSANDDDDDDEEENENGENNNNANTSTTANVAANQNTNEGNVELNSIEANLIEEMNEEDEENFRYLNMGQLNDDDDDDEGEDYLMDEDFFEDDDDDEDSILINQGDEYFDNDYLYSFGSKPKTKEIEIKCEKKELLYPIEEDTFALFVSSTFFMTPKDSDISNWTMLFYTMELVKCLLAIAESVGVMENQWPIHPKIKNLIKNLHSGAVKLDKGKEKEIDAVMTGSPVSITENDNIMDDQNESKPISSLLYTILDILHVHPDIKKHCKINLTEETLSYVLKIFTKPFLRQAVLLIYSRFFVTPEAVEVDQELNEYDRNLKFLNLPSSLSEVCQFINDNEEMKIIIKHWCDQWCERIKMNPFEAPIQLANRSKSSIQKKRERKSDGMEHISTMEDATSSNNDIAVANDNGLMLEPVVTTNESEANGSGSTQPKPEAIQNNTSSSDTTSGKTNNRIVNANQFDAYKIKLNSPSIIEMYPLTNRISDLIEECSHRKCKRCNSVPYVQTICLLCGEMVCFQSFCCNKNDLGECYLHSQTCGKSIGMYMLIKKCMVYINCGTNGTFLNAPYLDVHGEPDESYIRGKPQFLSPRRYEEIRKMWLNKTIPSFISQRLENIVDYGGWETI
ncbi:hypothetical protein BCR36DRAFT_338550 [Piromyces finnis]|uniref:E3 ubiquitin-protein ligase n=1 Tax=Piromyces finnis TaxID=1754191 RepID=A0A1Y1UWL5_9FUNG|nr:hypothetical protein BCR36DRAFT_338550 [Piromyces finnis]|eukprot:ORX41885.1 hypothetical protein BCR36DRAFT_338550 [Piromyces finnis]